MNEEHLLPVLNLKAVVQETGLKPDTLRAWERRYGLPQPGRSQGGHRLYSQYDVAVLKWLIARQAEGVSISRAVKMWQHLVANDEAPSWPELERTVSRPEHHQPEIGQLAEINDLRNAWLDACHAFDEPRADAVLSQAFALFPPEVVCCDLLQQAMSDIGHRWYVAQTTVHQEHFASAVATKRVSALLAAASPPRRQGRILVGCPPGEQHAFGQLLLALLMKRGGWDVVFLGADMPVERLAAAIQATQPAVTVFAAQGAHTAAELLELAAPLAEFDVPLAFGGRAFNQGIPIAGSVPGEFLGPELRQAPNLLANLVSRRPRRRNGSQQLGNGLELRGQFLRTTRTIESELREELSDDAWPERILQTACRHLGQAVGAALAFGEPDLIGNELSWLQGLLEHHADDGAGLPRWLDAFATAAGSHLTGETRELAQAWLHDVS